MSTSNSESVEQSSEERERSGRESESMLYLDQY